MKRIASLFAVALVAFVFVVASGLTAHGQYPPGYIYRCGGTGFLHVTNDVEDPNCVPLVRATQGGTGIASPGASGNVLSSTGAGWASTTPPPANLATATGLLNLSTQTTGLLSLSTQTSGTLDLVTQTSGVLPAANGGLPANTIWWHAPDQYLLFSGTTPLNGGFAGYAAGNTFRFLSPATITGVRYFCQGGGSQGWTARISTSTTLAGTYTDVAVKSCSGPAGGIQTCTFTTPFVVSNLATVYFAGIYGSSNAATCVQAATISPPGGPTPYPGANNATNMLGPALLVYGGVVYNGGTNVNAAPNTSTSGFYAAIEPVFTVP